MYLIDIFTCLLLFACGVLFVTGCTGNRLRAQPSFGDDVAFLKKHTDLTVLSDSAGGGQVAVSAQLQGRVMTSTAAGPDGIGFGWINRELIASGKTLQHINPYGGEDRFWIGPEGGQFSVFFEEGSAFDLEHWYTPAPLDTEAWQLVFHSTSEAVFRKEMRLLNYSGAVFDVRVDRTVRVLGPPSAEELLGVAVPAGTKLVAFESDNSMTNTGNRGWNKQSGLLSIWILSMFRPSPRAIIVIPFNTERGGQPGGVVNDAYFGKVPENRLRVKEGVIFFSADGQYRSKIGLSSRRARSVAASYDPARSTLTIVQYNKPEGVTDYVNSMWQLQDEPYSGDVVNAYNDGPPQPGAEPLGPFYELETSSLAAALQPGQAIRHIHRTFHFQGSRAQLDHIARQVLDVSIEQIESSLP